MIKTTDKTDESNPLDGIVNDKMDIINKAVGALLDNLNSIDYIYNDARKDAQATSASLMGELLEAMKRWEKPIAEDEWNKHYSPVVKARLENATKNGKPRYKPDSLAVMLNNFKVAIMAISFSRTVAGIAPGPNDTSLTKYVNRVRHVLQSEKDPFTGRFLLKAQAKRLKVPKVLEGDVYYWLVGYETDDGVTGANTIIAGSYILGDLEVKAAEFKTKFKEFAYLASKAVRLEPAKKVTPVTPNFVNAAVQAATVSSVQDA